MLGKWFVLASYLQKLEMFCQYHRNSKTLFTSSWTLDKLLAVKHAIYNLVNKEYIVSMYHIFSSVIQWVFVLSFKYLLHCFKVLIKYLGKELEKIV